MSSSSSAESATVRDAPVTGNFALPSGRDSQALGQTLVVGLGNPILGDDGVGWRVAGCVAALAPDVEVDCLALGGLSLMERLVGYRRVIIVDAIQTRNGRIGDLYTMLLDDLPDYSAGHTTSAHDTSLRTALRLGRSMGVTLPDEVQIVGVEAEQLYEFSDALTPEVEAAVPAAAQAVLDLLHQWED